MEQCNDRPQPFNGVNAVTGAYGLSLSAEQLVERVFHRTDRAVLQRQQTEYAAAVKGEQKETLRGVREEVDATARPVAIPVDEAGRPLTVSPADWDKTPYTVRIVLTNALQQIERLNAQLDQAVASAPVVRAPVYRDGGRSSGGQLRSAPTRGAVTRGGTTRSWQPPTEDRDDKTQR